MRTFSLLKDLPVFELKSGEQLGVVCDLSITNDGQINGLLVKRNGIIKTKQFLPIKYVTSFGKDGVMIKDQTSLEKITEKDSYTMFHHHSLFGKEMLTTEGKRLGLIEDVCFSEEMGTIIGYELTDGFFSDVTEGKRIIKSTSLLSIGKEAVIVNIDD